MCDNVRRILPLRATLHLHHDVHFPEHSSHQNEDVVVKAVRGPDESESRPPHWTARSTRVKDQALDGRVTRFEELHLCEHLVALRLQLLRDRSHKLLMEEALELMALLSEALDGNDQLQVVVGHI